jgi:pyridoxal phosphate enzyme (YggS family)
MGIKTNMDLLNAELAPKGARLVAVSKTHPVELIREAYEAGQRVFGENRVQELVPKYEALPKDIEWHLIGHLQTNKVKYIAPFVSLIHSVDSLKLLQEINKQGQKVNRAIPCLLQVYIAQEETKFGWDRDELLSALQQGLFANLSFVKIEGLMGVASLTQNTEQIHREMQALEDLFLLLKNMNLPTNMRMAELSIGMSADYSIALQHGSTLVRIGTTIFGNRTYSKP